MFRKVGGKLGLMWIALILPHGMISHLTYYRLSGAHLGCMCMCIYIHWGYVVAKNLYDAYERDNMKNSKQILNAAMA